MRTGMAPLRLDEGGDDVVPVDAARLGRAGRAEAARQLAVAVEAVEAGGDLARRLRPRAGRAGEAARAVLHELEDAAGVGAGDDRPRRLAGLDGDVAVVLVVGGVEDGEAGGEGVDERGVVDPAGQLDAGGNAEPRGERQERLPLRAGA